MKPTAQDRLSTKITATTITRLRHMGQKFLYQRTKPSLNSLADRLNWFLASGKAVDQAKIFWPLGRRIAQCWKPSNQTLPVNCQIAGNSIIMASAQHSIYLRIQIQDGTILNSLTVACTETLRELAAKVTGRMVPKPPNLVKSENSLCFKKLTSHLNKTGKNWENVIDSKSRKELSQLQMTCWRKVHSYWKDLVNAVYTGWRSLSATLVRDTKMINPNLNFLRHMLHPARMIT